MTSQEIIDHATGPVELEVHNRSDSVVAVELDVSAGAHDISDVPVHDLSSPRDSLVDYDNESVSFRANRLRHGNRDNDSGLDISAGYHRLWLLEFS